MHSADAVLLAAADAVANATMKLMASDQTQPSCGISSEMDQSRGTEAIMEIPHIAVWYN
jgi:hypothetical protein